MSQKEARHILINHKSDAAGGSDADHVGDDAFVETSSAFIPTCEGREKNNSGGTILFFNSETRAIFFFSFEDKGLIYKHCIHTIQGLSTACAKAVIHKKT